MANTMPPHSLYTFNTFSSLPAIIVNSTSEHSVWKEAQYAESSRNRTDANGMTGEQEEWRQSKVSWNARCGKYTSYCAPFVSRHSVKQSSPFSQKDVRSVGLGVAPVRAAVSSRPRLPFLWVLCRSVLMRLVEKIRSSLFLLPFMRMLSVVCTRLCTFLLSLSKLRKTKLTIGSRFINRRLRFKTLVLERTH